MAYAKSAKVTNNLTRVLAEQYNALLAEVKAAIEGIPTHPVDTVITYNGGSTGQLPSTITITDNSGDTGYNITCVVNITYDSDDLPVEIETVFDSGEMNVTMTEEIIYTDGVPTSIERTLSS
jgi:hypothetical protein